MKAKPGDGTTPRENAGIIGKVMIAMTHGDGTFGKWGTVIAVTLGMVLLVIGANAPSFAACLIGIAIIAVIGTIRFIAFRNGHGTSAVISDADYRKDLVATLNGYGLDGKYDNADIERATASFTSHRLDATNGHAGEE
jgi:membrane-bound ClpP family serine protease